MTDSSTDTERYRAPALDKGLDILELLASTPAGLSHGEIARQLDRTRSEIFRMLLVLRHRGYVEQGDNDRYLLTTKMFEMAHRHPPIQRLTAIAGEMMQELANRINQSVHMSILHGSHLLIIAQVDCADHFLSTVRLGSTVPVYDTASGRAIAAFLSEATLAQLLRSAGDDRAPSQASFLADLPMVKKNGYFQGVSRNIAGVIDLSAPVFDMTGTVVAALTTPYIERYNSPGMSVTDARAAMVETAAELSRRLGAGAAT